MLTTFFCEDEPCGLPNFCERILKNELFFDSSGVTDTSREQERLSTITMSIRLPSLRHKIITPKAPF